MNEQELIRKIRTLKKIEPNKDWVNFCYQGIVQRQATSDQKQERQEGVFGWFSWSRFQPAKIGIVVSLIMIFGFGGTIFASFASSPGDFLYPVKIKAEKVPIILALKKEAKVRLQANLANKRVEEISKLTEDRPLLIEDMATNSAQIVSVAKNLNEEILSTHKRLQELQKEDKIKAAKVAQEITSKVEQSEKILAQASRNSEGESKEELENAIKANENLKAQVYSAKLGDPSYVKELENRKTEIISQIEELEKEELNEEQKVLLEEIKELLESESPIDIIKSIEKINEIEKISYPQLLEIQK